MQYRASKELRALRLEYANEINSDSPSYEKLCDLYDKILKMGCRISAKYTPERYRPLCFMETTRNM